MSDGAGEEKSWQERGARWFCIALWTLGGYLLLRYAAAILVPFGLAFGVAAAVQPLAKRSAGLFGSQRVWAVAYVILLLAVLGTLLFLGAERLWRELKELFERLGNEADPLTQSLRGMWERLRTLPQRLPLVGKYWQTGEGSGAEGGALSQMLKESLSGVGAWLGNTLSAWISATPGVILGAVVGVMACFYFAADYQRIGQSLLRQCSPSLAQKLKLLRQRVGNALRAYAKAYLILFALTFVQLWIGLALLRIPYAFLIALGIALADLLPLIGSGALLIPWAVVALIGGNHSVGLGLLILFGVMSLVRQVAEPHLLGETLGIHPLASLFFMFVGWKLFGLLGLLLGPAAALLIKELFFAESGNASKKQET